MSEITKSSGITRQALYKALQPNSRPRFDTISRVCAALGVRLEVKPIHGKRVPDVGHRLSPTVKTV